MNNYLFTLITEENKLPYYVKGVGGLENQDHIERTNGYTDYQWIHCIKGAGKLLIDGKEFIIRKNTGFLLYPGIPHEYYAIEEPWETHWVTFDGQGVTFLLNSLGFKGYELMNFKEIKTLDNLINDIYAAAPSKSLLMGYKCSEKLYSLLIELRRQKMKEEQASGVSKLKQLEPVIAFIDTNYSKSPTIEDMAETINASPQYLCRLFNKTFRMRPFVYMTLLRMQKAKELLIQDTALSIKDVAEASGYNDTSYFCSIFKKHEAVTPSEFRMLHSQNR
ncbi:MAG TPA: AraC family transcriptional regulator [Ruminiclostridium sp.]